MTFFRPEYLWWLLGLPVLGVVLLLSTVRARKTVSILVGNYIREDVMNLLTIKSFVVTILFSVALSSLVVAIAGPQWGEISVEDERRGLELVFLIDVSNSMLVDDVSPSRLGRAREVTRSIVSRISGAHHAVVVFKGSSSVLVPMTDDPAAFELAVSNLSPSLITTAGTDLVEAIPRALEVFPAGTPRHRAIVLFSDGGHDDLLNRRMLDTVRDSGIPIYTVATGTSAGGTIPTTDGGILRDDAGNPIIVGMKDDVLKRIAEISGGTHYSVSETNLVQRLATELEQIGGFGATVLFRQITVDRYHFFVVVCLFLLAIMILIQNIRWRGLI